MGCLELYMKGIPVRQKCKGKVFPAVSTCEFWKLSENIRNFRKFLETLGKNVAADIWVFMFFCFCFH